MLRDAKLMLLRMARGAGVAKLVMNSSWRRNRLLILSYHGTSIDDEHEWNSSLYLAPAALRFRMETIRAAGCNVLPLDDALNQLYRGVLPPRSVVITFDDGTHDFYAQAFPILKSFGFPVTVYLTTYYAAYQRPVYDVMVPYLAWKSRGGTLRWPEVLGSDAAVDVSYPPDRRRILQRLGAYPAEQRLSGAGKDELLCRFAELLGVDYDSILRRRLLHIMSLDEARELAAAGVGMQLHTHRHGVSRDKAIFQREVADNRTWLRKVQAVEARHLCYPGGVHRPDFLPWLREMGVASATTCESGLASGVTEALLLPRLVDTGRLTEDEFVGWLSGIAAWLPGRPYVESTGQFLEER